MRQSFGHTIKCELACTRTKECDKINTAAIFLCICTSHSHCQAQVNKGALQRNIVLNGKINWFCSHKYLLARTSLSFWFFCDSLYLWFLVCSHNSTAIFKIGQVSFERSGELYIHLICACKSDSFSLSKTSIALVKSNLKFRIVRAQAFAICDVNMNPFFCGILFLKAKKCRKTLEIETNFLNKFKGCWTWNAH